MAFSSITADRIVSVVPSAIGTGGTALSMSTLLISPTTSPRIIGVREFGSAAEVGQVFGLLSDEYAFAERYFLGYEGATKIPERLWLAGSKGAALPAVLQSATMRSVTLNSIKQTGALGLVIGGTNYNLTVNLTSATSFSDAASIITTALTTATAPASCAFVASAQVFEITTTATGTAATITLATGAMAEVLRLSKAEGAQAENGTAAMTVAEARSYYIGFTSNFAVFADLVEPGAATKREIAEWTTLRRSRFMSVVQDTTGGALVANNPASFGAWLTETKQDGTLPYFGGIDKIAALCGGIAAIDFKRLNGRRNIMFMSQAGLSADVTNEADYTALISNGYTFYAAFATANDRFQFQTNGAVAGKFKWADNYINQIYFNSQMQLAKMKMLKFYGSIPYNDTGKSYQRAASLDPINEMLRFGGIRPLINPDSLSEQQKSVIRAQAGQDIIPDLLTKGWVHLVYDADAQTRGNRGSMPETVWYTDGGSVQSVNLASVNVQ